MRINTILCLLLLGNFAFSATVNSKVSWTETDLTTGRNISDDVNLLFDIDMTTTPAALEFASLALNKGALTVYGDLILRGNIEILINEPLYVTGDIILESDATITTNKSTLTVDGNITSNGHSLILTNNNEIAIGGNLTMEGGSVLTNNKNTITVGGNVTLQSNSPTTSMNNATLSIGGAFNIENDVAVPGFVNSTTMSATEYNLTSNTSVTNFGTAIGVTNTYDTSTWNGVSSTLPVELVRFEAKSDNNLIVIEWATASECDNKEFHIQISNDGGSFRTVKTVKGHGNSSSLQQYSSSLNNRLFSNTTYLRLLQVDFDGSTNPSKVLCFQRASNKGVFPSMLNSDTQIDVHSFENVCIYSASGIRQNCITDGYIHSQFLKPGMYIFSSTEFQQQFIVR